MRHLLAAALALIAAPSLAENVHIPAGGMPAGMTGTPPFSAAVWAGNTLYVAGTTDGGAPTAKDGAKLVLDHIKATVEKAGLTMDDLVWVQVFATDLKDFNDFNAVYRTYFKGPMPARAFLGAGSLLGGAHFEVMGVAYKAK
ncbi:2-iminobutanoate/2-iminopropanoate deaminase [Sphingomonas vulcanisoli]|uniref:2-iminobutanoate/2-iminopropanoate deaminase n=1 Tax=Sphingomonas vulcanisoli TaxID=1658060 RepID=A0ABX0TVN1_9SPHN|nr:RidA family protein [Sphingomonas vulcanisoli]NIJ09078.1 2-iminobutanoate/2-iminopropanoate deaminase [Sphingomonas vulcanisoli]